MKSKTKKVKVHYVNTYPIVFMCPEFVGKVKPGEIIEIPEEVYLKDLKTHNDWELKKA